MLPTSSPTNDGDKYVRGPSPYSGPPHLSPMAPLSPASSMEVDDNDVTSHESISEFELPSPFRASTSLAHDVDVGVAVADDAPLSLDTSEEHGMELELTGEDREGEGDDEGSSSDESDAESSEMDEETVAKKKVVDYADLLELEQMFLYTRELVYAERMSLADTQLEEITSGRNKEMLALEEEEKAQLQVLLQHREYRYVALNHVTDSEKLAARQDYENEKKLLYNKIKEDIQGKIRSLEEERQYASKFSLESNRNRRLPGKSVMWKSGVIVAPFSIDQKRKRKYVKKSGKTVVNAKASAKASVTRASASVTRAKASTSSNFVEKKKEPVVVTGPFIVYMLDEGDIMEDWNKIVKATSAPKRNKFDRIISMKQ